MSDPAQPNRDDRAIVRVAFHNPRLLPDCVIAANGDTVQVDRDAMITAVESGALLIAADGGLRHCTAAGLTPDALIGDLDSVTDTDVQVLDPNRTATHRYPAEKDETDLELAILYVVERGCQRIMIVGGVGDRFDQTVGNLFLLGLPQVRGRTIYLRSGRQSSTLLYPGTSEIGGAPSDTLSLLPINGSAIGITTDGLQYPLRDESLHFGPARGVSNVMLTERARVTFREGVLLAVHTEGRA